MPVVESAPIRRPAPEELEPLTAEELELKQRIEALLRDCDWNVTEVARRLAKDRTQIYRWIRRFGLQREGGA
jgi:transcriptional regulator of acetoin/glycerol metabolism